MSQDQVFISRLKAAQRDLITACGGLARAARISNYSVGTVGRWHDAGTDTIMPMMAVRLLEIDCGQPFVTAVMAEETGRRLTDPQEEKASDICVMLGHAEVMRKMAELATDMAMTLADGKVTPAEAARGDRISAEAQAALNTLRSAFAGIKVRGGAAAGLRVVGDDE